MSASESKLELVLAPLRSRSTRYYLLVTSLLALVGWGLYAFYFEYVVGLGATGDRLPVAWGLNVINFVYFIAISMAGTIISGILRLSNAAWRKPITRIAEAITIAALPIGALFPLLDLGRPERAANLLLFTRLQSPISWDSIAIGTYLIASLLYFYVPLVPDLAICRDSLKNVSSLRRWLYSKLSLNWSAGPIQEKKLGKAIKILAILVVPIAVSVHSVLSWVFSVTLRVEWHSTVFPIFFVAGAVFSGLATILVVVYAFRRFYHLENLIELKHILNLAYIFLAADLVMIYLTVSEYLAPAWSSEVMDSQYLASLVSGAYSPYFWFMLVGGLIIPAVIVALPQTRKVGLIVVAALLANAGMWIERYLIVVPSLAVPQLPYATGVYTPSWAEISMTVAGFAALGLILVIISRYLPIVSIYEIEKEGVGGVATPIVVPAITRLETSSNQGEPESTYRRNMFKSGTILTVGLAVGLAASHFTPFSILGKGSSTPNRAQISLSTLGESVTPDQALKRASFPISIPTSLPEGTELADSRISSDGGIVSLLYVNSSMETLGLYTRPVDIAVFQSKDELIKSPPIFLPKGFQRITVNEKQGFVRAPLKPPGHPSEPGQIQWWADGKRCSIFANLPISELTGIARSMQVA